MMKATNALEAAVVVDVDGQPMYWHTPVGRSAAAIPDSRALWLVLWDSRERLAGVAHTHPGGVLQPSSTDLRTFAACEDGLGRRLSWWLVSADRVVRCTWSASEPACYICRPDDAPHVWLDELRRISRLVPAGGQSIEQGGDGGQSGHRPRTAVSEPPIGKGEP